MGKRSGMNPRSVANRGRGEKDVATTLTEFQFRIDNTVPTWLSSHHQAMKNKIPKLFKALEKQLSHIYYRIITRFLLAAAISVFVLGCGTTLSPVKRKPLDISPLATSLAPNHQVILVRFESTLPGKPLCETVWDNASGAFADIEESKQIGFTQDYSKLYPVVAGGVVGGAVGGVIGGLVVVPSETQPDYTRIVIPFGRIFQGVFQSGLQKAFPNSPTSAVKLRSTSRVAALKIEFQAQTSFGCW